MANSERTITNDVINIFQEAIRDNKYYSVSQTEVIRYIDDGKSFVDCGDIIIKRGNKPYVLIEIKRDIYQDGGHIRARMISATMVANIRFAIITDGKNCLFYDASKNEQSSWEEGLLVDIVRKININERSHVGDSLTEENIKAYMNQISENINGLKNKSNVREFINNLSMADFVETDDRIHFTAEKEQEFFQNLLGDVKKHICRYSSVSSLFRILKDKEFGMCGLICMNDKSECFYADNHIDNAVVKDLSKADADISDIITLNEICIMSFVDADKNDDLTMWRLYGDNGKGVSMTFKCRDRDNYSDFFFAKISYGRQDKKHPELDLIKKMTNEIKIGDSNFNFEKWNVWKHFFKSHHFAVENESRLIYQRDASSKHSKEWIITDKGIISPLIKIECNEFPLKLERIIVGPVAPEKQTLVPEIKALVYENAFCNLKTISLSNIDIYR